MNDDEKEEGLKMLKAIRRAASKWGRQRRLQGIMHEFARCGYPVERVDDAAIEAAFAPGGARGIEKVQLSGKAFFFALRRLSSADGGGRLRRRKRVF